MNIGLVLDGGGGKGAYQIGVWKAMREFGLDHDVKAIAGTSIGGLNAALFVQGDYDLAEQIWTKEIKRIKIAELQIELDKMIDEFIDMSAFSRSSIDCFLAAYCSAQSEGAEYIELSADGKTVEQFVFGKMSYFNMRVLSQQDCRSMFMRCTTPKAVMLATSALPVFCDKVWIGKKVFRDGGIKDNSPVYPLSFHHACDTIIVIHLDPMAAVMRKKYPDLTVYEIIPNVSSKELGFINGTLNFDTAHAERLIEAGYRDSREVFRKFQQAAAIFRKNTSSPKKPIENS